MNEEVMQLDGNTEQGISAVETWATGLEVKTPDEHDKALSRLKEIKGIRSRVVEFFAPSKSAALEAHRAVVASERAFTDRLDRAEATVKPKLLAYQRDEEEKRLAEQRRLQSIADEKARREQEKLAAQAAKAEASGKTEKAEALREAAATVEAPVIAVASRVETKGSSIRMTWKGEVIDMAALIAAAAPGTVAASFIEVNQSAVDAFARSTRGGVVVMGVRFSEVAGLSVSKR